MKIGHGVLPGNGYGHWLDRYPVAELLDTMLHAADDFRFVALVEIGRAEVFVRLMFLEHVIDGNEHAMSHGDNGPLGATPGG